jgi:hypothetical protein
MDMARRVAVSFDEKDIVEIEIIVRDEDEKEALALVRRIRNKIEAAERSICGQGVMGGTQPPR